MLKGSYTNVIAPHSSVNLGFSGVKNGTPDIVDSTLTEIRVNEELIGFKNNYYDEVRIYVFGEYNGHLKGEERVYVGKVIEISNSEINRGSLSFTLGGDYTVKEYEAGGVTTNGLLICYNDGEDTVPLETDYDTETRTLSAEINSSGIYFVLDVMGWLDSYDIEIDTDETTEKITPVSYA